MPATNKMEHLQKLVNSSYEKISELELLLIEEYKLTGDVNLSTQLSSILLRQKKIVDRALSSLGQNVRQNHQNQNGQPQPSTSSQQSQPFNSKTNSNLTNYLSKNKSKQGARFDRRENTVHDGLGSLESKGDNNSDVRSSSKSNSTLTFDQPDLKQQSRSSGASKGNESSWYGSLDRNFVKRKKGRGRMGSELDKSRRHRKTVASLATLEQTGDEELQPDEQYEIGLPPLSTSASCNFSKVSLDHQTMHKSQVQRRAPIPIPDGWTLTYSLSRPSPPLPPSAARAMNNSGPSTSTRMSHSHFGSNSMIVAPTPSLTGLSLNSNSNLRVNFSPRQDQSHNSSTASFENIGTGTGPGFTTTTTAPVLRSPKSKAWFETNLDASAHPSLLLSPVDCSSRSTPTDQVDSGNFLNARHTMPMPLPILSPKTDVSEKSMSSRSSESSISTRLNFLNESTKPFEMSDVYKYSSRYKDPSDPKEHRKSPSVVAGGASDHNGNPNSNVINHGTEIRGRVTGRHNSFKAQTQVEDGAQEIHLYQNLAQVHVQKAHCPLDDDDLGWVMDTPTFV